MIPLLLLAGVTLTSLETGEPVLEARVADIDADGKEDIVAVTATRLLLFRGGEAPAVERDAAPLTVVGRGLLGIVRDGRYRGIEDPFGAFIENEPGPRSLLASLGRAAPAILESPGDLDGDGKADPILATPGGFHTPRGVVRLLHEARLEIYRNETFAVEYAVPVPALGNWSGKGKELVIFHKDAITSYLGTRQTDRIPLPLTMRGKGAAALRRNHVFLRDIDGDRRLDLLVVMARGSTGLFGAFEASARLFSGGRVYDHKKKGFFRPASFLKIAGALLAPDVLDLDGDGDLDLVLSTINTSVIAAASGTAPGTYLLFRLEEGAYRRKPAWSFNAPIPLSAFTERPDPPVVFLPDLDGDGHPEALMRGEEGVRLLEAGEDAVFQAVAESAFGPSRRPHRGKRLAVAAGVNGGILVVRGAR